MRQGNAIPNPVPLGFRVDQLPDDPGTVYDQGRVRPKDVHLREIWSDDLTRTLWLAIKTRHITDQYFKVDIVKVAAEIRRNPVRTPLALHRRIEKITGLHWDDRTKERGADDFCEELFAYVSSILNGGGLRLAWTEPGLPPAQPDLSGEWAI